MIIIKVLINQCYRNSKDYYLQFFSIGAAFLPAIIAFLVFIYVTKKYSTEESDQEKMVRNWYNSKFIRKRRKPKVAPLVKKVIKFRVLQLTS